MVLQPDWYGTTGAPAEASMKAMKYSLSLLDFGGYYLVNIRFTIYLREIVQVKSIRKLF